MRVKRKTSFLFQLDPEILKSKIITATGTVNVSTANATNATNVLISGFLNR